MSEFSKPTASAQALEPQQHHRDEVVLVGIALVVNDAVPFRYPAQVDCINGLPLEYMAARGPESARLSAQLNSDRLRKARNQFWRLTRATFAELFLPPNSEEFYGDNLELIVDDLRLVCHSLRASSAKSKQSSLVSFSVLVALDASLDGIVDQSKAKLRTEPTPTSFGKAYPLSLAGVRPYRTIARDLANALLFSENAERFVAKETKRALEENCLSTALQQELKNIYHGLVERGVAHFHLPERRLCASFNLFDPRLKPTMEIRPYHALLIAGELDSGEPVMQQHQTLQQSLAGANKKDEDESSAPSVRLSRYFRMYGATRSIEDAAEHLGMSLEQTCRLASYLRQWERARVCHNLQDWSMFQVNPAADLKRDSNPLFQAFAAKFPGQELARVLAKVTEPRSGTRIPRRLRDFSEFFGEATRPIFSWLMAHKLVVECFQFIYFVPNVVSRAGSRRSSFTGSSGGPEPPSPSAEFANAFSFERSTASAQATSGSQGPTKAPVSSKALMEHVDGRALTASQLAYLKTVGDLSNPVFRVLLKLCPLFGSSNHVQEILFRTGVSLSALKIVLEQYSECLFVTIHEL